MSFEFQVSRVWLRQLESFKTNRVNRDSESSQIFLRWSTIQAPEKSLSFDSGQKGGRMLRWALAFFIVAIIAALFGFTGIAVASAGIAKILFVVFLVLFLLSLIGHLFRRV
jgi:uncharacterized membrane protein YtjA (UPF0391 family)